MRAVSTTAAHELDRRVLSEAGESIERVFSTGVMALKKKLGLDVISEKIARRGRVYRIAE